MITILFWFYMFLIGVIVVPVLIIFSIMANLCLYHSYIQMLNLIPDEYKKEKKFAKKYIKPILFIPCLTAIIIVVMIVVSFAKGIINSALGNIEFIE